jgi:GWxTD domain-containing protein
MLTMVRLLAVTILFCGCFAATGISQDVVRGRGRFQIEFDAGRFFGDEHQVYVEFYYGIHENSLFYVADSGKFTGTVHVAFEVKSESAVVARKEWLVPHSVADTLELRKGQIMTGLHSVGLTPGNYQASLVAYDINDPGRRDSVVLALPVQLFPKEKEVLSDIELCTTIHSSSNKQSLFYKNTLEVMPNPSKLFGMGLPILYYYVESYNLSARPGENVIVRTSVLDAAGKEVIVQNKTKPRNRKASVEIGTVNLSSLKGGTFLLRVNLVDSLNTLFASTAKKFFVYRPGTSADTTQNYVSSEFTTSEYSVMTQEDVDREYAYTLYLRTDPERKQYEALTDVASKQKFLFEFWKRHHGDDLSPGNKFKAEYIKRIESADNAYTSGLKKGRLSDRGRVAITYGTPDEIERFPSSSESSPYEIWHYTNIQGGVLFVFVDRNSFGDYTLVHSTHRDELHDENWFQQTASKTH